MGKIALFLISVIVVAFGQPAFYPWMGLVAATVGFALFWRVLDFMPSSQIGKVSFIWFLGVQFVQLFWMANLEYQGMYILILYLLLTSAVSWQFSVMTKLLFSRSSLNWKSLLFLASFWTLLEWTRLYVSCGFAFNFLGLFLSGNLLSLQMASLFGVFGMSFWVILTNLLGLKALRSFQYSHLVKWAFFIVFPFLYGFCQLMYHQQKEKTGETQSVLLVQTALTPSQKYPIIGKMEDFIPPMNQWKQVISWISSYKKEPLDLIVFPEAAFPFGFDRMVYKEEEVQAVFFQAFGDEIKAFFPPKKAPFYEEKGLEKRVSNAYWLQTLANALKANILSGLDYEKDFNFYNSAFYFEPDSSRVERYDKRILLPLAESMPFSSFQFLSKYYGVHDFFSAGQKTELFSQKWQISPSICYEELFPGLMREGRKKGAFCFVSLSNDGWFPSSKLPEQHFTHGLIRSVENGVPLIRACNTGVTAVVDGLGRVIAKLQDENGDVEKISGCLRVDISFDQYKTLFTWCGEVPLLVFCFIFCFFELFKILFPMSCFLLSIRSLVGRV